MDALLEWFKAILSFLGPILVVVVTIRGEKNRRADEAEKKLEQQQIATREKELNDTMAALNSRLSGVETKLSTVDECISKITSFEKETRDDVKKLSDHYKVSTEGTRELARLVMVMSEGLRDQHLDGNITQAIAKYRKFERSTLDAFLSTPPEIDDD